MSKTIIILMLSVLMLFVNVTTAQNKETDIERLDAKILELQQRIIEMQKKHNEEINALKQQINELAAEAGKQRVKDELTALRESAKARVAEEAFTEKELEETTFKSGGLGLQALNPEISVTGDGLFSSRQDTTSDKSSDFDFRTLGIHIESWLDPYTRFKAAIPVTESGSELGEGYLGKRSTRKVVTEIKIIRYSSIRTYETCKCITFFTKQP